MKTRHAAALTLLGAHVMRHKWWRLKLWFLRPPRRKRREMRIAERSTHAAMSRNVMQHLQREISFQLSEAPVQQQRLAELKAEVARLQAGGEIDQAFLQRILRW